MIIQLEVRPGPGVDLLMTVRRQPAASARRHCQAEAAAWDQDSWRLGGPGPGLPDQQVVESCRPGPPRGWRNLNMPRNCLKMQKQPGQQSRTTELPTIAPRFHDWWLHATISTAKFLNRKDFRPGVEANQQYHSGENKSRAFKRVGRNAAKGIFGVWWPDSCQWWPCADDQDNGRSNNNSPRGPE